MQGGPDIIKFERTGRRRPTGEIGTITPMPSENRRFLRACRGLSVDATPVWFMRQAGRYMEEYRALRKKHSILELAKTPALACEVTLQPIRALPVDAAILFADILLPVETMGLKLKLQSGPFDLEPRPHGA